MKIPFHNGPNHNQMMEFPDDITLPSTLWFLHSVRPFEPGEDVLDAHVHQYALQAFRGGGYANYGYMYTGTMRYGEVTRVLDEPSSRHDDEGSAIVSPDGESILPPRRPRGRPRRQVPAAVEA